MQSDQDADLRGRHLDSACDLLERQRGRCHSTHTLHHVALDHVATLALAGRRRTPARLTDSGCRFVSEVTQPLLAHAERRIELTRDALGLRREKAEALHLLLQALLMCPPGRGRVVA